MSARSFDKADAIQKLDFDHHQVIEASAGTGKTYTIEQIIVELILEKGANLSQILLITYTEKAATELKNRVRLRIEKMLAGEDSQEHSAPTHQTRWIIDDAKQLLLSNALNDFDSAFIGTIHSFCARMTKEFALICSLMLDPQITHDAGFTKFFLSWVHSLQNQTIRDLLAKFVEDQNNSQFKRLPSDILSFLSEQGEVACASKKELIPTICQTLASQWKDYKHGLGVWTFDDMLSTAEEAIKKSLFVHAVRQRFQYVIIDEFQDTDLKQWNILKKLFVSDSTKLFVVGDPKQAIYRFKGGDIETYKKAKQELLQGRNPIILDQNFRSTPELICVINQIFQRYTTNPKFQECFANVEVKSGKGQESQPNCQTGIEIWLNNAEDDKKNNESHIIQSVALKIQQLLQDNVLPDKEQIAVLVRTKKQGQDIAKQLKNKGIPYSFYKQSALFQTPEARDIYYFLEALINQENQYKLHFTYLFNPKQQSIQEVQPLLDDYQWSHWALRASKGEYSQLFQDLFQATNLAENCVLQGKLESLSNYQKIVESIINWSVQETTHIDALLLILKRSIQKESQFIDDETDQENVTPLQHHQVLIMTIHASKGLEFSHVFVFGLWHEKKQSQGWSIIHDGDERKIYFDSQMSEERKQKLQIELDQELLNLTYVACTRAKNMLYLPILKKYQNKRGYNSFYGEFCQELEKLKEKNNFSFENFPKNSSPPKEEATLTQLPNIQLNLKTPSQVKLQEQQNPFLMGSYTSLSRQQTIQTESSQGDALESDANQTHILDSNDHQQEAELPKGVNTGNFLHEALENVDIATLKKYFPNNQVEAWKKDSEEWIAELMRKYGISTEFEATSLDIIWKAWTNKLTDLDWSLCETIKQVREPRFILKHHGKQLLNGAIDLVFEYQDQVYFVDWKSNLLESYEEPALKKETQKHYDLQIRIYSQAIKYWLQINNKQDFQEKIGGCFYIFLRGLLQNQGIYFQKLSWDKVQEFSQKDLSQKKT